MKRTLLAIVAGLLLLTGMSHAQDAEKYRDVVSVVARQFISAATNSFVMVQPADTNLPPTPVLSTDLLLQKMRAVGIDGCPVDFKLAWLRMEHALENYKPDENGLHQLQAAGLGVFAIATHSSSAADKASDQLDKVSSLDEFKHAFQHFEDVLAEYVD